MKKGIFTVVLILLIGVFAFSGWKIFEILQEYRAEEIFYEEMTQFVSIPEPEETKPQNKGQTPAATEAAEINPAETNQAAQEALLWPTVDFTALREINPDVVGWIYIPDTHVNYPILQGETNDTYLRYMMSGEYNSAGSIFLDADVSPDFSARNTPIYGHHMKNGTMFADIADYKDQSFYDAHPYAMLLTPNGNYCVRIFSGYVTDVWDDAWNTGFSEDGFASWLQKLESKSYFYTDIKPTTEDRIVTFSTCTYEYDDARFVVHGVLEFYMTENESAAE